MLGFTHFLLIAVAVSMVVNIFIIKPWLALIIATPLSSIVWLKICEFIEGRADAQDGVALVFSALPSFFIALTVLVIFLYYRDKKRIIWSVLACLILLIGLTSFLLKRPLFHRLLVGDVSPYSGLAYELKVLPTSEQESYVPKCIKILQGSNGEEKAQAAYILGSIGLPMAAPAISKLQEAVKDPLAGDAASTALAQLGFNTQSKIEECLKILESNATPKDEINLRNKAIKSLAAIDGSNQRDSLSPFVPKLSLVLLNTFIDPDSTDSTAEYLIRSLLNRYVDKCGIDPTAVSKMFEPSFPILIKIIKSEGNKHHDDALYILGQINTPIARQAYLHYSEIQLRKANEEEERRCGNNKIDNFRILKETQDKIVFSADYVFDQSLAAQYPSNKYFLESYAYLGGRQAYGIYSSTPIPAGSGTAELELALGTGSGYPTCAKSDTLKVKISVYCTRTFPYKKEWRITKK